MIAVIVWTVLYPTCLPLITCSLISSFMWRDFAGILLGLFNKFKIDRFLSVLLDSLVDYRWEANFDIHLILVDIFCFFPVSVKLMIVYCSSSDESCQLALISILETVPSKNFVHHVVPKVLSSCLQNSQQIENSTLFSSGLFL